MRLFLALLRWAHARNGGTRPAQVPMPAAPPSPVTAAPASDATRARPHGDGGEGHTCAHDFCHGPAECVWEYDGELRRFCSRHCAYCNPGGNLDLERRRQRMAPIGAGR